MRNKKQRVLIARFAAMALAVCGLAGGYLLGRVLSLRLAEFGLDQYSKLAAAQDDASFQEGRSLLAVMQDSPLAFCSDAEIAYFREQVFRSQYLKDAGRIQGGKIECSAISGHPLRTIGQFKADSTQTDGIISYSNLVPIHDASLKRAGLQLGTAFVVLGPHVTASPGTFPMHLSYAVKDAAHRSSAVVAGATTPAQELALTTNGTGRLGDTLYATRCSTSQFNCVTAYASFPEAMYGESWTVYACTAAGAFFGIFFGLIFWSRYNRSQDLCQQLRRAVERDKLRVVYQPIVKLASGEIVGAEALSRWNDDYGNPIGPDVFIKMAEEHGYMGAITKSVVHKAMRAFAETLRKRPDFRISMNVSAADLVDPNFLPMLEDSLKRAKVDSKSMVIEITERATAESETAKETIRILQRAGFSIHIDDFGTGYSNLDKLLYLYADAIKIDKAFTKVIGTESVSVAILPQILSIAKSLNLEVVVEGVETERQADYFSSATDRMYGQGWLYGYPVPAEEFLGVLAKGCANRLAPPEPVPSEPRMGGLQVVESRIN